MSFTLMRYKNGQPAPIKMSIWDAFKGTPPPKPPKPKPVSSEPSEPVMPIVSVQVSTPDQYGGAQIHVDVPVECPCCNKVHTAGKPEAAGRAEESNEINDSEGKHTGKDNQKGGTKTESKDDKQAHNFSTHEQETYSKKDNKTIIELKKGNSSWKEILKAIGKESQSQLKEHWKEINPDADGKNDDKDDQKSEKNHKNDGDGGKKNDNQTKKQQNQQSNKKSEAAKNPSKKNSSEKTEQGELMSWSDRYDRQKWIAAASRHFDLTGQRITPAIAKQIAEGK